MIIFRLFFFLIIFKIFITFHFIPFIPLLLFIFKEEGSQEAREGCQAKPWNSPLLCLLSIDGREGDASLLLWSIRSFSFFLMV